MFNNISSLALFIAYLALLLAGNPFFRRIIDCLKRFRMSPMQFLTRYNLAPMGAWSW